VTDEKGSGGIDGLDDLLGGVFDSQDETLLKEQEETIKKEFESRRREIESEQRRIAEQEREKAEQEREKEEQEQKEAEEVVRLQESKELWVGFLGLLAIIGVTYAIYRFFSTVWAVVFFLAVSLMIEKKLFAVSLVIVVVYWFLVKVKANF